MGMWGMQHIIIGIAVNACYRDDYFYMTEKIEKLKNSIILKYA